MFNEDAALWANFIFGKAQLGDPRRTQRVVHIANDLAANVGSSLVKASADPASIEGAYRYSRNHMISPEKIALAGFQRTDEIVKQRPLVLAIQDTTGLSFRHSVCTELGSVNSGSKLSKNPVGRTLFVHSTLMLDADSEQVLGLAEQDYFYREKKIQGKTHQLQGRERQEKESFKWQKNQEALSNRMGTMENVIDVCDREADIYEYLEYQISAKNRFLVRASENRLLNNPQGKVRDIIKSLTAEAYYYVDIKQKGGRKGRKAKIALSYQEIKIKRPQRATGQEEITLNMIVCQEVNAIDEKEKLCWVLYTTEAINSVEDARKLVRYYEVRWRVEEFHKTWKTDGTQVEELRMQSRENLKRIAVIQAFVAVRLMQLQDLAQNNEQAKLIPCISCFSPLSWKILWKKTEKKQPFPDKIPSLNWAYYAIAKLGGWYDSKRTGRVGVKALWTGWIKLMDLVEAYEIMKELQMED
jgi:hypothetical protein